MTGYRHTTAMCGPAVARLLGVAFGLLIALILLPIGLGYLHNGLWPALVVMGVIVFAAAVFFPAFTALTVEVDGHNLRWHFRHGLYRRSVPLSDIRHVEDWEPHGWRVGVRYFPSGSRWWVRGYCVGAQEGIRVQLQNGKQICLETDEPKSLQFALREALAHTGEREAT